MTTDDNKALVRRFITEIFEQGDLESVDELCADGFIGHTWGKADKAGLKQAMARVATGLADAHFQIDDMIAEDDRVAVRVTASARQVGEFMGMPASGRSYEIGEIHIFRVRDGKVAEHWHEYNPAALMKQLSTE
ncbi:MAG: ester cyclase [Chloroflexota bacterium]|nr:ester cyclase [Chloroflexota bacterium]